MNSLALASSAARTISSMVAPGLPYAILVAMVPWNSSVSCSTKLICSRSDRLLERLMSHPSIFTTPDGGIVEARHQADDGRFPGTGRTHQRRHLSRRDAETHVAEHRGLGTVLKATWSNSMPPWNGGAGAAPGRSSMSRLVCRTS